MQHIKKEKRSLRKQMKNWKIKVKDVAARSTFHENTVKDALNPELPYWNQTIIDLANEIIIEKTGEPVYATN